MVARLAHPQRHNLPAETTSFVGRREEIAAVARALRLGRLVTLVGVPGVGKTRLATHVARGLLKRFRDGVWLVELSAVTEEALALQSVADVLHLQDQSARPHLEALSDYLAEKRLLLVLDNCEHLLLPTAQLAQALLKRAPGVRLLATSRAPLRVYGEQLVEVNPLPLPAPGEAGGAWRNGAPRLFGERAAAAAGGFTIGSDNRDVVATICERVDGIPLAVELAAARVRDFPVEEVLTRLDDYFDLLAHDTAGEAPELPALRATIDWSYDLCSEAEQTMWARASVFAGGFDAPAAQAVCADEGMTAREVEDLIGDLIDKSILVWDDRDHVERYRMPEPLRQYGQQLAAASGERAVLRARHRDYYAELVDAGLRDWLGPDEVVSSGRLRRDHANVRSALDYSLAAAGENDGALRVASTLWIDWVSSGSQREGRHWLDAALQHDSKPTPALANALWVDAWLALQQADSELGRQRAEQARSVAEEIGNGPALAHAVRILGMAAFYGNDLDQALVLLGEALDRHRANGDRPGIWISLLELAIASATSGDLESAVAFGEECLALSDDAAHLSRSWALWSLGLSRWSMGDTANSLQAVRASLLATACWENQWAIAHSLEVSAWIAQAQGEPDSAARLLGAAETIWRSVGASPATLRHLAACHDECARRAEAALGAAPFAASFAAGQRMPPEQAVALVPGGEGRVTDAGG